jgi:rod shape determining protein RodA
MKNMAFMVKKQSDHDFFLKRVINYVASFDYLQIISVLLLLAIGLIFIYSTGQQVGTVSASQFWLKQVQWIVMGTCFWTIMACTNYRDLKPLVWVFYVLCMILLVVVLVFGLKIYGARRWLDFGSGIRLQPSELAKLAVLLLLSYIMTLPAFNINKFRYVAWAGLLVAIPFLLIAKEPDLGSAIILIPIFIGLIFVSGLKWKYIITAGAILAVIITAEVINEVGEYYPFLKTYQKERLLTFLDPERDITHRGYNQFQARLAVGSGGATGKGIGEGTQNTLGFLPQTVSNNDFIFSVIAEETGFAGCMVLIISYILLTFSILRTAFTAPDDFGRFIGVGTACIFFAHSFINMGMSIGVNPVTGVCLPFVSYGGSFMLLSMTCLGILQSVYRHRKERNF